jgi:hypothetical protein
MGKACIAMTITSRKNDRVASFIEGKERCLFYSTEIKNIELEQFMQFPNMTKL